MVYFLVYYPRIHFHLANIRYGAIIVLERATSKWLALWCYEVTSGPIRWLLFLFAPDGVSQTEGCKHKANPRPHLPSALFLMLPSPLARLFAMENHPSSSNTQYHSPFEISILFSKQFQKKTNQKTLTRTTYGVARRLGSTLLTLTSIAEK